MLLLPLALAPTITVNGPTRSVSSANEETGCFVGKLLVDQPLHHDAGIDHIAGHAAPSRSRSARIVSLLSTDEQSRRRSAAARAAKCSSVPSSEVLRISRCSASADRPLNRAGNSGDCFV